VGLEVSRNHSSAVGRRRHPLGPVGHTLRFACQSGFYAEFGRVPRPGPGMPIPDGVSLQSMAAGLPEVAFTCGRTWWMTAAIWRPRSKLLPELHGGASGNLGATHADQVGASALVAGGVTARGRRTSFLPVRGARRADHHQLPRFRKFVDGMRARGAGPPVIRDIIGARRTSDRNVRRSSPTEAAWVTTGMQAAFPKA